MSRKGLSAELWQALKPLLPAHARYREKTGDSWSVTWSDPRHVWTVSVTKPVLPWVRISNDATETYGLTRQAELEIPRVDQVIAVMTGLGALPYSIGVDTEETE